nr:MAG TPA: hypothetical protein [Caudoviricetes sp.]
MVFNMDSFSASVMAFHLPFIKLASPDRLGVHGIAGIVGNEHAPAVLGSGEALGNAGELAVVPLRAVVKADLAEELILLTGTGLRQRLQEEVALAGNRLVHGSDHIQVQQQSGASGKTLAQVQVDHADRSDHTGQGNAVNLPGSGNHGQAVLNSVSVDLEQRGSVTPQAQAIGGSVGPVNLLHHVSNVPQAEGLAAHGLGVGGDRLRQSPGLVYLTVLGGLVVGTLNEGELNVPVDLLHLRRHLEVQLIDGVGLLVGDIQAGQGSHVGLLGIGDADSLHENLRHIGLLGAGDDADLGSGQGGGFADRGLCAAASGVLLAGHELNMVGGLGSAADDGGQGAAGIAFVEEHTGVVQYPETGSQSIGHKSISPLLVIRLSLGLSLSFQAGVVGHGGEITVLLGLFDLLAVIHGTLSARARTGPGLGGLLDCVSFDLLRILFEEFALVGKDLGTVAVSESLGGVLGQSLVIALGHELGLVVSNGLALAEIGKLLFHLGQLVSVLLLLLFLFGKKSIVLALPLGGLGVGLGKSVLLLFQLGGIVLILEPFQSGQLLLRGHLGVPLDLAGVNLCHNKYLLRLTRLFTQH